mmetsp:Transcript_5925/g.9893  ORF Transcript_5925/g.9893 Transcript_5925/m.9893 type:complete len:272 (-) Transcript_5925:332-1147(-)
MSRAFTPPDTLSQDDIRTVADVRRAVWINGLFGLGAGSAIGMIGHLALQTLQRRHVPKVASATAEKSTEKTSATTLSKKQTTSSILYKLLKPLPPLTKNTFLLSFLGGGALGSFVLSSTAGKNAVHLLHPIFNVGRDEYAGMSPYQIEAKKAEMQQSNVNVVEDGAPTTAAAAINQDDDQLDIQHHKQRTLHRKASIKERLESGHSLSDTHSTEAHYHPSDEEEIVRDKAMHRAEVWERRQTERRRWVKDKIESGGSLSDSHVTGGGGGGR